MFFLESIRRWWRDRQRNIFKFHDGVRTRYADPVAVGTALEEALPQYVTLLATLAKDYREAPPGPLRDEIQAQQRDAAKKLASAARKVFDIPALDTATGWGATEAHAVAVVARYWRFMEDLARAAELFADSPVPESASPAA